MRGLRGQEPQQLDCVPAWRYGVALMVDSGGILVYDRIAVCRRDMSEEQLSALLAKLKDDAKLRERLKGATDLDVAVAIAKEAGLNWSREDWLRHKVEQTQMIADRDLEAIVGGSEARWYCVGFETQQKGDSEVPDHTCVWGVDCITDYDKYPWY